MPIKFKNVSTNCIIDTGAVTSFMSLRFLRKIDDMTKLQVGKYKMGKTCYLADKTVIPILGEIKLPCYINKVRYNITFCVLKRNDRGCNNWNGFSYKITVLISKLVQKRQNYHFQQYLSMAIVRLHCHHNLKVLLWEI